jgi:hypothetical protein
MNDGYDPQAGCEVQHFNGTTKRTRATHPDVLTGRPTSAA